MTTLKPDEVMYAIYMRHLPDGTEWVEQETTRNEEDARYWMKRNTERNAAVYEEGAGREYVLVRKLTRFELGIRPQENAAETPCVHEWFEGRCVHCEITAKEFRAAQTNAYTVPANQRCRCGGVKDKAWHLVCASCWIKLPGNLRDEVWDAYKEKQGSERHRTAIRACVEFLRAAGVAFLLRNPSTAEKGHNEKLSA